MKKIVSIFLLLAIINIFMSSYVSAGTIYFSNIGNSQTTIPPLETYTTVSCEYYNGYAMIKLTDLASITGATLSIVGNNWFLDRNGQTTLFVYNSYTMSSTNSYSIYNPATSSYVNYSHTWNSSLSAPAMNINGFRYVPYENSAKQIGSLIAGFVYVTSPALGYQNVVFDFRVNGTTPLNDTNDYIVGGSWITDWSLKGDDNLAPHFDIHEIWSDINYGYARQMKISASALESAERVRYYYNNNSSMNLSSGFRSWDKNINTTGSGYNSFHMRARAWDCGTSSLYTAVRNEFRNGQTDPIDAGGYWRSRIPTTGNSRGYEIEKMPNNGSTWLHLQRQPGSDNAPEKP